MSMDWFKWWVGAAHDPKFFSIAKRCGTTVTNVIGIWAVLLERASDADDGSIAGFDTESFEDYSGLDRGLVTTVIMALEDRGLIENGRIRNWEKRQQRQKKREDNRVRKQRQREREALLQKPLFEEYRQPTDAPNRDFQRIREFYTQHIKVEGPYAGEPEFRQLLARKGEDGNPAYPGTDVILEDLQRRVESGFFKKGYSIGLRKYFQDQTWLAPVNDIGGVTQHVVQQFDSIHDEMLFGQAAVQKRNDVLRQYGLIQ